MIERKEGIKPDFLELPLSGDTAPSALHGSVSGQGMMAIQVSRIVRILIRQPLGIWTDDGLKRFKKCIPAVRPGIVPWAVLSSGKRGQVPLGRHGRNLKPQNQSTLRLNGKGHAEGFTLRVLTRLQVIKLHRGEWLL